MKIELFIQDQLIESIEIDFTGCHSQEQKWAKTKWVADWLKYKYRETIGIYRAWEIIASQKSKLNNSDFFPATLP